MKRKILSILLITLLLVSIQMSVFAVDTVTLNNISDINKGDTVTISGSTTLDKVTVKVTRPDNTVLYVNVLQGPEFSDSFKMPADAALGVYKVVVGQGNNYASKTFQVKKVTEPDPEETPETPSSPGVPMTDNSKIQVTVNDKKVAAKISVPLTKGKDGVVTASIFQSQISAAVNQAIVQAEKQGVGIVVDIVIQAEATTAVDNVQLGLTKESLAIIMKSNISALIISTPLTSITFDQNSLTTLYGQVTADFKISVSKVGESTLSKKAAEVIGERPVFNFSVISGDKTISQFGGQLNVALPYTPKAGEDINSIFIYYIDANDELKIITNSFYDAAEKVVKFQTNHFSKYAVGYNKVNFKDVPDNAWFAKAVSFISAREITSGVGDNKYAPDRQLTRAQFIVMMMRAYEIAPDTNSEDNFADAGNTYYTAYLAAAKQKGISAGIGDNMFGPEKTITRQEMLTLLYNALKAIDKLPEDTEVKNLNDFNDTSLIASRAKDAFVVFVNAGVISGSNGRLNATAPVDRAQMAQVLFNLLT